MSETKPGLGPKIKELLVKKHGSLWKASQALAIGYERLRKAVVSNRFNPGDLEKFQSGVKIDLSQYDYVKTGERKNNITGRITVLKLDISEEDRDLIRNNKSVREKIEQIIRDECRSFNEFLSQ